MRTKIQRWGNSVGLRIPKPLAIETRVREGSVVDLTIESGRLIVRPVRARKYELDELLRQVRPRTLHGEVAVDGPRGRESW